MEWTRLVERLRRGETVPFDKQWDAFLRIPDGDVWSPDERTIAESNLGRFLHERGLEDYAALHRWSVTERAAFWQAVIERLGIVWAKEPERMLEGDDDPTDPTWAPGARLNIVESCFTAPPEAPAIVQGHEDGRPRSVVSYAELQTLVARFAAGLARRGLGPGSSIALYMPMTVECVAAYLGTVRAGGRVVSIADSFSAAELARRLEIGAADAIVTVERFERAGKTIRLFDKVREAGAPAAIVIDATRALRPGDVGWDELLDAGDTPGDAVHARSDDTINVLFSSGTTGTPKAIPWTHLTPVKCAMDGRFHQDIRPGDVVAWPTNIGWMMGPWLIFAALCNRATIALYEGAPHGGGFVRFVADSGVTMLGVVPSLVAAWRGLDAPWPADWSGIRAFSSTGEPSNRRDYLWLMARSGYRAPVIEYCGGTEIGGGYVTGTVLQPCSPATFTTPALGLDLVLLDDEGRPVAQEEPGEVYLVPPSIGLSQRLLNRDHHEAYYAGVPRGPGGRVLRRHGDRMTALPGGRFRAGGRTDDTMNLGGIKVGSLELERTVDGHPGVRECAAVGVQPGGEGAERLVLFVVAEREGADAAVLKRELGRRLAERLNPLFRIHDLRLVESLPRTASNKLMRRELRAAYNRGA
jgi:acetyl-CoA synthetase